MSASTSSSDLTVNSAANSMYVSLSLPCIVSSICSHVDLAGFVVFKEFSGFVFIAFFQAYDQHLNMILGDVEEIVTTVEIDDETYEEIVRVCSFHFNFVSFLIYIYIFEIFLKCNLYLNWNLNYGSGRDKNG